MGADHGNGWGLGPRVLSRPIPVVFQGWRSNTMELQAAGWELSTAYDMSHDTYMLAISNPQLQVVGRTTEPIHIPRSLQHHYDREHLPTFYVNYLTHKVQVYTERHADVGYAVASYHRIDAMTQVSTTEVKDLHDLCHFAPWNKATDVIVSAADLEVVELLKIIVDKQQPKQKELREKMARAPKVEHVERILRVA